MADRSKKVTRRGVIAGFGALTTWTAILGNVLPAGARPLMLRGGVGATAPTSGVEITMFNIDNHETSTTPGIKRGGMVFAHGDAPPGTRLKIQRGGVDIAAQFDNRSYFPDGNLRACTYCLRDTDFGASESRSYTILREEGAFNNVSSATLSQVTADTDFQVIFSTLKGSIVSSYSDHLSSFNTHAAVATRVDKYESGPVCDSWRVWGMASAAGNEHDHLKVNWFVTRWKDAGGDLIDYEYGPEPALDWFAVPDKERMTYTATLKNGTTTIATYTGIEHLYATRWFMGRKEDDLQHATRHFLNGDRPTLNYRPNRDYWISTRQVPRLDITRPFVMPSYASTYVPGSHLSHRDAVDSTGPYVGRGEWPNSDCIAFITQTPANNRIARVNAFVGLHIPYHLRSEGTRVHPVTGTSDIANTVVPNILWHEGGSAGTDPSYYTFSGMPAAVHAYVDERSNPGYDTYVHPWRHVAGYIGTGTVANNVLTITSGGSWLQVGMELLGHLNVSVTAGTRVTELIDATHVRVNNSQLVGGPSSVKTFINGGGYRSIGRSGSTQWYWQTASPAHAVNYSHHAYLLEGERYFLESTLDLAAFCIHVMIGEPGQGIDDLLYGGIYPNVPSTQWAGAPHWHSNDRANGWMLNNVTAAAAIVPTGEPQEAYITAFSNHTARYHKKGLDYAPAINNGAYLATPTGGMSPWMDAWITMFSYVAYDRTRNEDFLTVGHYCAKLHKIPYSTGRMQETTWYHYMTRPKMGQYWNATSNPWLPEPYVVGTGSVATNGTITCNLGLPFTNGDRVLASDLNDTSGSTTIPPELTLGVHYYIRDATATTFKLSLTSGGAAITYASAHSGKTFGFKMASLVRSTPISGMSPDNYASIRRCAVVGAILHNHPDFTPDVMEAYDTFLAGTGHTTSTSWATWAYASA